MNIVAGVILTATLAGYSTVLYSVVLHQRYQDAMHFVGLYKDLNADFIALCDYLDVEITHDEQEPDNSSFAPETCIDGAAIQGYDNGPDPLPRTEPMAAAWDASAAELVEQAPPPATREIHTVSREIGGRQFRFRDDQA